MRVLEDIERQPRWRRWAGALSRVPGIGAIWTRARRNPKEFERFCKFAIVGAIGAVVDFTVLNTMKLLFEGMSLGVGWNLGLGPDDIQLVLANAISFSVAVLSNFTWNRLWTFPESRERPLARQLLQFAAVNVLGLAINEVVLLAMNRFVFQLFVGERLSYNLAKAVAIGVVLFWNFGVNRVWTYRGIE